jgi:acyl-CoA synthetase (AMP-forming)/AMP-acid ligase II
VGGSLDAAANETCETMIEWPLEEAIRAHGRDSASRLAVTFGDESLTYGEIDRQSNAIAHALLSLGCGVGDRIAVVVKNCMESYLTLIAARKIGAVQVAMNWRYSPREIAWIVNDCQAQVLLVDKDLVPATDAIRSAIGRPIILFATGEGTDAVPGFRGWTTTFPTAALDRVSAADEVAIQLYTSGTTGNPKGALITNSNLSSFYRNAADAIPMRRHGNHLIVLPLFHVAALIWSLRAFVHGGHCIGMSEFDAESLLEIIPRYEIHDFAIVHTVLAMMVRAAPPGTRFDMDAIIVGGGALSPQAARATMSLFGCPLFSTYGSTELTYGVTMLQIDEALLEQPHLLASCGRPMQEIELGIFDHETLAELPEGATGEIWVRGGQRSQGYWQNPEATRDAFLANGWFRTGDMGRVQDGYLYVSDRLKDMIRTGGENVYPAEVERQLGDHPDIVEAVVIGVPDEKWGETVLAQVIRRPGAALTADDVMRFARERLAGFKCPRKIDFVADFPRTPSGKPQKHVIRAAYWTDRATKIG